MSIEFVVTTVIAAPPEEIYHAWLDSEGHTGMTGSPATASDRVGDEFRAWDGYISGVNLALEPGKRILQSWRTSEFEVGEGDSQIEVLFEPVPAGTQLTLRHTNLPPHGHRYKQGWVEHYFEPMKVYFGG